MSNPGQAALPIRPAPPPDRASTMHLRELCRTVSQKMKVCCSLFIVVAWGGVLQKVVSSEHNKVHHIEKNAMSGFWALLISNARHFFSMRHPWIETKLTALRLSRYVLSLSNEVWREGAS